MATAPVYAGIDFGTSNCTAGYLQQDEPTLWPLEDQSNYLSSALYIEKPPVDDEDENKKPLKCIKSFTNIDTCGISSPSC